MHDPVVRFVGYHTHDHHQGLISTPIYIYQDDHWILLKSPT